MNIFENYILFISIFILIILGTILVKKYAKEKLKTYIIISFIALLISSLFIFNYKVYYRTCEVIFPSKYYTVKNYGHNEQNIKIELPSNTVFIKKQKKQSETIYDTDVIKKRCAYLVGDMVYQMKQMNQIKDYTFYKKGTSDNVLITLNNNKSVLIEISGFRNNTRLKIKYSI